MMLAGAAGTAVAAHKSAKKAAKTAQKTVTTARKAAGIPSPVKAAKRMTGRQLPKKQEKPAEVLSALSSTPKPRPASPRTDESPPKAKSPRSPTALLRHTSKLLFGSKKTKQEKKEEARVRRESLSLNDLSILDSAFNGKLNSVHPPRDELNVREFMDIITELVDSPPTRGEMAALFKTADEDGSGGIDRDELIQLYAKVKRGEVDGILLHGGSLSTTQMARLDDMFKQKIKQARPKRDYLNLQEFTEIVKETSESVPSVADLKAAFAQADEDNSGGIDRDEMIALYSKIKRGEVHGGVAVAVGGAHGCPRREQRLDRRVLAGQGGGQQLPLQPTAHSGGRDHPDGVGDDDALDPGLGIVPFEGERGAAQARG